MTQRKSERLVNLLIALLSTRRFLTKQELRHIVEGYRDSNEVAFERQFERDKEELRGLGIAVETGSNDAFFDDEEGYRINRADFELPEIAFTAAELSALALAGQVWQDSVAADHTAQAFEALQAGGAAPDPSLVPTVRPQVSVAEPDFDALYDAVLRRVQVTFGYGGASRSLQPWRMLQRRGRWYVFGFDTDRQSDRFFKLSRFTSPAVQQGRAGAFEVPPEAQTLAARLEPVNDAVAVVALRDGIAHTFGDAEPQAWDTELPAGFTAHRVALGSGAAIVDEVAAAGPDAILLAPADLRAQVIRRLEEVAP
ncbi:hypothetical protein BW730_03185 [Tessaracoccus aquimaris]|uniref:WYL domain-containing protein n=1 Tax=Tessaracoccus aquimaris TaxID=1332264 RepID=A0A1Q2CKP0_9ACTN|nr:WYL domain-containing protein [Tessaracoccus aquimaris]AQP46678.1 hypothetical protein BW730_03185 [Tessaracoccus aquimaris]